MNRAYQNIPELLQRMPQWVVHREKVPYTPATRMPAKAGRPETWGTFSQALAAVDSGQFDGIGFEFESDNYLTGIDLDHCILPDGTLTPEARQIVDRLDTYTEISTSGDGLHLIIAGEKSSFSTRCKQTGTRADGKPVAYECYNQNRYFVMTGNVFEHRSDIYGGPDHQERIDWYCRTFIQLEKEKKSGVLDWEDEISGKDERPLPASSKDSIEYALNKDSVLSGLWNNTQHTGNESADDLALLNKLAYWLDKDPDAMRENFLRSPYAQTKDPKHQKKMEREDYLLHTIQKAVADCARTAQEDRETFEQSKGSVSEGFGSQSVRFVWLSEVQEVKQEYLFRPYIPLGTYSIIAGESGMTKTWFCCYMVACVTTGRPLIPGGSYRDPANVLFLTKENDYSSDIVPRLRKMGADFGRVAYIDDKGQDPLTLNDRRIYEMMQKIRPALVLFDPIQSYVGAKINWNAMNEVRPILDKVMDMAREFQAAVVTVAHLNKMSQAAALDRINGTSDFRNSARSILIIGADPEAPNWPETRALVQGKCSGSRPGKSFTYHIDDGAGLVFDEFKEMDVDSITVKPQLLQHREGGARRSKTDEATDQLKALLDERGGYLPKCAIENLRNTIGASHGTMANATKLLGLEAVRMGFGGKMRSWFIDPEKIVKEDFKANPPIYPGDEEESTQLVIPAAAPPDLQENREA